MTYEIEKTIIENGKNNYYTYDVTNQLEKFIPYLKTAASTIVKIVQMQDSYSYNGNLTSYLLKVGYGLKFHYPIMRMNNMKTIYDFGPSVTMLLIPNEDTLTKIYTLILTEKGTTI